MVGNKILKAVILSLYKQTNKRLYKHRWN